MSALPFNVHNNTSLKDIQFGVLYSLYTKQIKPTHVNDVIKLAALSIAEAAKKQANKMDMHVLNFINQHIVPLVHNRNPKIMPKALLSSLESSISSADRFDKMLGTLLINEEGWEVWNYLFLPNFFLKNPTPGLPAGVVESFDEFSPEAAGMYFSKQELINNCSKGGYIKSDIKVIVAAPTYDAKLKKSAYDDLAALCLLPTKPTKLRIENNLQLWEISLQLKDVDRDFWATSVKFTPILTEIVNRMSTGKKYFIHLDGQKLDAKGFKSLDDVQAFLNEIGELVFGICTDYTDIYLRSTLNLMSIHTADGTTVSLKKFRFKFRNEGEKK